MTKTPTYVLKNLELEYASISSNYLSSEATSAYSVGKGFFYENVLLHKVLEISKGDDSIINEHINIPRRSMTGILCLFNVTVAAGLRDSEKFTNPDIQSISISIDGMPNKLYSKDMTITDFYDSIKKRMNRDDCDCEVTPFSFYSGGKYGLWIDLRTFPDHNVHGSGFTLDSVNDGIKLEIRRKAGGSGKLSCFMYVVSDALVEIVGSNLKSVKY